MPVKSSSLNSEELRAAALLAAIVALRLFGLFLIYPVFAVYAKHLAGATPALIGIGLGVYGLTQGALQIPAGWLSDKVGRKRIIAVGLVLFVLGSALAALSSQIWGVIAGRALQGCGAIAGAAMALAADLSRPAQRSKVMAVIGASIGAAFMLALVFGSLLAGLGGLAGLFWISVLAGALALCLLLWLVPEYQSAQEPQSRASNHVHSARVIDWCFGAFLIHALLTALFVVLPATLTAATGMPVAHHWLIYVPALGAAGLISLGIVFQGEERRAPGRLAPAAVLMALGLLGLAWMPAGISPALIALSAFFAGFSLIEATLPALVSHSAAQAQRGAALGVYASCQFLGVFAGGVAAGLVLARFSAAAVFVSAAAAALIWGLYAVLRTPSWVEMRTA